jgi:anti-sigma factor RsiW
VRKYEVTCRELVELITDYLEDALPRPVRKGVEAHLETCSGCRTVLAQMRETIRLTGALADDQIPEEHRESLLTAFRDWKTEA